MKNVLINLLRGISYVSFPVGVFLFGFLVFGIAWNNLDFTAPEIALSIVLFFFPPFIILFLHPLRTGSKQAVEVKFDRQYLMVTIMLALLGLSFFFLWIFYLSLLGFIYAG